MIKIITFNKSILQSNQNYLIPQYTIVDSMIVPDFKLKQNEKQIEIYIRIPYLKVTACQFHIQQHCFKFYLKPYLLSLSFKQPLLQVEEPNNAVYYHEKHVLQVHLLKKNVGQHFEDLDILTNLLTTKKKSKPTSKIQVISGQGTVLSEDRINPFSYGFSQNFTDLLNNLDQQCHELFSFDPRNIEIERRYQLSQEIVIRQFDYEHYLYDRSNQEIKDVLKYNQWKKYMQSLKDKYQQQKINNNEFKLKMKINGEVLIGSQTYKDLHREIFSLLFSYFYELISMGGQFGPESAKTISKTSLILNSNAIYYGVPDFQVIKNCFVRVMTYSLYQSLQICRQTLQVMSLLLDIYTIKICLLDLKRMFEQNQPRYLLNRLYIDNYIMVLMKDDQKLTKNFEQLKNYIKSVKFSQNDLDMKIKEYEQMQMNQLSDEQPQNKAQKVESHEEKAKRQLNHQKLVEELQKLNMLD